MTSPTLCAIPGCAIRGRHLPGCDDPNCRGCLPRLATEGLICETHERWAAQHLAEIERLCPDARLVAAGQVRRGHGGTGGKPGSRPPLNVDAVDVMDAVQNALTTMAREIAEERGLQIDSAGLGDLSPADPIARAAKWLSVQLGWLRHATLPNGQPYAMTIFAEIRDCAARMRGLVDPVTPKYFGPCGAPYLCDGIAVGDQGQPWAECGAPESHEPHELSRCEGDVYGVAGAQTGRCRTCGATVDQAERRIWLEEQVSGSDLAWTARGIADALNLNVKTVRAWATPHVSDTGVILREAKLRTYYRLGEHIVPWVEIDPSLPSAVRKSIAAGRGPRLHYVGDVRRLAKEAAERRAAEGQRGQLTATP